MLWKKIRRSLTFTLLYFGLISQAQQQTHNWYFGYGAGLNFKTGKPVFQEGKINQWEGCATISDRKGRMLFYTDGRFVWNRQHKVMPEGKGLKGHQSSAQSSVIVPDPYNDNLFYLFTVAMEGGRDGLQYSIVDMFADDGLGDVIEKNIQLLTPVCEKVTAVRHSNNKDVWVITHKYNSDEIYAYLVDKNGIRGHPVVSTTGNIITGRINAIGYLKSSPHGKKLAAAHFSSFVEVLDFNNSTGQAGNPLKILPEEGLLPMGVEFSPDEQFLYVTQTNRTNGTGNYEILQYRISGDADSISASKQTIASGAIGGAAGALQLGPDGKIYVAFNKKNFLGCITSPNNRGEASGFELESISLGPAKSGLGLPAFIQSYFIATAPTAGYTGYVAGLILLLLFILFFWLRRRRRKRKGMEIGGV